MKKLHSFIKHLVAILLGTVLVGMSVYAVQIPTSLNNALQYIMETIWTSDGTASGTTNVQIWTGGIYIATGFLQNGNAWNNMSLGLDTSGNVVYVPGSSSTPIFSLASNFIPKLDSLGSALEISVMYQSGGLIGVNKTNPTRSVNILGDFLVETQGLNVTYQYNFLNSNTGLGYPAVDINTSPRCSCDINATTADCNSPSFSSLTDQGFYCVDLTVLNNGNNYDHNVYTRQTIGIPSAVLSTSGANVGVGTDDPQTSFHVEGGAVLFNGTSGTIPNLGTGTRFVWTPSKAALRIGFVDGPWRDDMYIGAYSNVLGGYNNIAFSGSYAVIGGGSGNFAGNGLGHVVVGGEGNNASSAIFTDNYVFIGGGYFNSASAGNGLTLVGGYNNSISKPFLGGTQPHYATLVGGFDNEIYNGPLGFIGGGSGNYVEGTASSILGGEKNRVSAHYGVALGKNAQVLHDNSFVWNNTGTFATTTTGQFLINAYNGVGINTNTNLYTIAGMPVFPGLNVSGRIMSNFNILSRGINVYDSQNNGVADIRNDGNGSMYLYSGGIYTGTNRQVIIQGNGGGLFNSSDLDVVINPYGGGRGNPQANVGIGLLDPQYKLHVNGVVAGVGAYLNLSDGRYKTNETPITDALNKISSLQGISYLWDIESYPTINFDNNTHLGFIAQDVAAVIPEAVSLGDDGFYSMDYSSIIPVLVEAIKEQQAMITDLEARVTDLETP